MKIKYNDSNTFIFLTSYTISDHLIMVSGDIEEKLSGFILYSDDEKQIIKDCSDFVYRWDVEITYPNTIYYTNLNGYNDMTNKATGYEEFVPAVNIHSLIDCIADLMYETSLMKLGMEE